MVSINLSTKGCEKGTYGTVLISAASSTLRFAAIGETDTTDRCRAEILWQRTARSRFRSVIRAKNPTDYFLVDVDAESRSDLCRNSWTAPGRISPLYLNDGGDEFFAGSLRT